jgi:2-oxoglutarate/2-oxoacid ferredoxin oxidoreductase subunit beta
MPQLLDIAPNIPQAQCKESGASKFCPGCGHGMILKTLALAIDELNLHEKTIFGVDIGCSLLAWNYMDLDTVQCHHGRTTPVIYGVTRAVPGTVGIAYMGDGGGLAIGAQHLVNAAVRNEKMLVVLVNNTNYGMTGGQMAPTTMPGQVTETTPYGRDVNVTGKPAKGAEMVAAIADPEKAMVVRASISNLRKLRTTFKKALTNVAEGRGFSFVEVLSVCPLNWRTNNVKTWDRLDGMEEYFEVKEFLMPKELEGVK